MLLTAVVLFLIAAGLGMVILVSILQNKKTPKPYVYAHGAFAALALLLVIYYVLMNPTHAPTTSLVIFLIAAVGGFTMFFIDMKGKPVPKWLALLHPVIAVTGVLSLLIFILGLV